MLQCWPIFLITLVRDVRVEIISFTLATPYSSVPTTAGMNRPVWPSPSTILAVCATSKLCAGSLISL